MNFRKTSCALPLTGMLAISFKPPIEKLFNGKDLSGWEKYLAIPSHYSQSPQLKEGAIGKDTEPLGTIMILRTSLGYAGRREPAIRISGEAFGSIISHKVYQNYH